MKGWIIGGLLVVVVLGLVGWKVVGKKAADDQLAQSQKARNGAAPSVDVAIAGAKPMDDIVTTIGSVDSPYNVKLSPKLTGLILSLGVRQGDNVKAGQSLVSIDPTETQGQVLQARQALAEAKFRLAQAEINADPTNVGVKTGIKQQQAAVNSAKADQNQIIANYKAQIAAAQALVTDADSKVASAKSQVDVATQNLATSEANERNAKAKYDREYSLYQQSFVAAQDLDDAKTALDVAKAAAKGSQAQVRAANSALASAQAQRNSTLQNLNIVLSTGISNIADAKAHAQQADAALELALSNRAQTPAYRANIEALKAEVGVAEGTLKQALARLNDTTLRSPIDGTVTDRGADPGTVASPGTAVLTIQYLDWVFVTGGISIDQAPKIHEGQPADITFDAFPDQVFHGTLTQVVQSADVVSRQFNVQIKLNNPNHLIRPGMFGHVSVIVQKYTAAVTIPREAVTLDKAGNASAMVVDKDNVAHLVAVKLGKSDAKSYEILEGVKAGDTVISLSYSTVKDGKKVKPNAPKTPPDITGGSSGERGGSAVTTTASRVATGGGVAGGGSKS
jgi:RND family efflux transporter MFP subunit